jgi:hypothetical protein
LELDVLEVEMAEMECLREDVGGGPDLVVFALESDEIGEWLEERVLRPSTGE